MYHANKMWHGRSRAGVSVRGVTLGSDIGECTNRFTIDTALWDRDGGFRMFEAAEGVWH
jgi:hypothetical protein